MSTKTKLFKTGEKVEISGTYMCLACGEIVTFKEGNIFNECPNCGAGGSNGPAGFKGEVELWRLIQV